MLSRIFDWARGKGQRARGIGHGAWGTRGSRGGGEKNLYNNSPHLPISPAPLLLLLPTLPILKTDLFFRFTQD